MKKKKMKKNEIKEEKTEGKEEKTEGKEEKTEGKEEKIVYEGLVTQSFPNGMFHVRLDNENQDIILGYISGKIRQNFIRILPGDRVKVELSFYDTSKGRIFFRIDDKKKKKSSKKEKEEDLKEKEEDLKDWKTKQKRNKKDEEEEDDWRWP
uniref:translation initiation factor 1 n=1 Tax=Dapsilanthus disjunctus TaxID=2919630 RepID=UPI001F1339D6|nr:translation initiation factor 1 [Dapsilanthus disjunctus]ULQ65109.1 translation initiation factor 1 [Dapsilanthus disjunctus]ULQ65197.1 translation initiation factor 1 [Dapsilanthus disjunctus]